MYTLFWYFERYHIQFIVRYYRSYVCVSMEIVHLGLKRDSLQKGLVVFFSSFFHDSTEIIN